MFNRNKQGRYLDRKGQSTVEFILSLTLIVGFVLFLLQLSLVMAYGNYAQYVTFMAARAYLSSGADQTDQINRATAVIQSSLKRGGPTSDRLPMIAKGSTADGATGGMSIGAVPGYTYDATQQPSSWMQGVRYAFNGKIFLIPIGTPAAGKVPTSLTFKSEAFLGRESTASECATDLGTRVAPGGNAAYYDNGC